MSWNRPVFTSSRFISHPVTEAFGLSPADVTENPSSQLDASSLVIVDCRQTAPGDLAARGGLVQDALDAGKVVLFLDPGTVHTEALRDSINGCPEEPQIALAVRGRTNPSGVREFDIDGLGHPLIGLPGKEETADSPSPRTGDPEPPPCRCACAGQEGSTLGLEEALDSFVSRVRSRMDPTAPVVQAGEMPTGLKYFQQSITQTYPFTYKYGTTQQRSPGSLSLSWIVWGFLSQSQTSNSQILAIQASYWLNPGKLISNDKKERGFVNVYLNASAKPDEPSFGPYQYQPTSACNSWSGTVSFPVSYLSPLGGYQIYPFSASVNDSVSNWCVQNISSGASLGSQWYMNSPCNGSKFPNGWQDAFDFWDDVKSMPSASTSTLGINAVSAWMTPTLQKGEVRVAANLQWLGADFYRTFWTKGCRYIILNQYPSPFWLFNFAPLNPS